MRLRFIILTVSLAGLMAAILWMCLAKKYVFPAAIPNADSASQITGTNEPPVFRTNTFTPNSAEDVSLRDAIFATNGNLKSILERAVGEHNQPMVFYGCVVDQDSNPLSGVKVRIGIVKTTMPDPSFKELLGHQRLEIVRTTDAAGRFEINGVTGDGFGMMFEKSGYESESGSYGSGPVGGSLESPIVFRMWDTNIHEQLITGEKKFTVVPDGPAYVIDLLQGTISDSGDGDLKIWIKYSSERSSQIYNWACAIDVPDGGLLEQPSGTVMFVAPTNGYAPEFSLEYEMKGGQRGESGNRKFYLKLRRGKLYGKLTINRTPHSITKQPD